MNYSFMIALGLYIFASICYIYYIKARKIPTDLKKYKQVVIPSNGLSLKEIADRLTVYNVTMKLSIEGEKLLFQDKLTLRSSSGKMYIVTVDQNNLTLYYKSVLGFLTLGKLDIYLIKSILEIITLK